MGLLAIIAAALLAPRVSLAASLKPVRRVLIFYELGLSSVSETLLDREILNALDASPFQIELYREYLETTLFPGPIAQQKIRQWYLDKYRDRKPDLIIALGPSPLRFVIEVHERAFKNVPVVFGGTSIELAEYPNLNSDFTGIWERFEPDKTLEVALRLQHGTKHVVVVGGTSAYDRRVEALFRDQLRPYEARLDIEYLTDLDMPTLLNRLGHLPPNTIILYTNFEQDAAGTAYIAASQADPMMAEAANAPIFTPMDVDWGHGEVGGYVHSFSEEGKIVGNVAREILGGKRPQDIPITQGANIYLFDWRALRRWGFSEGGLPPGSVVLNRQFTLWEAYKLYIVSGLCLLLAQTILIVGLLWQRARRKKAEVELGKSEQKFSKAFRHSPLAITIVRASDDCYVEVNETFELQTGWKRDEIIARSPLDVGLWVDTDQRTAFLQQLLEKGNVRDFEVRFRRKDGQIRTGLGSAELIEVEGESCALSVIADITERKQAEEVIAGFSGKLIDAQEAERTRIARELHDDINQRLAMVAVNLKTLKQDLPGLDVKMSRRFQEACEQVAGLENDIQALSHRLHSSKLEYLGLEAATASLCAELSERQNVKIDFRCDALPEDLPSEVSLCLFRVLQEALHNALKYSGVGVFEVSLTGSPQGIELKVHDSGAGFDAKVASNGHGLGLTSMRERLKLVGGQLSIDSKPNQGTTVFARVPLSAETAAASAAA
jgi:PAS domain S-box-containing protein